MMTVTSATYSNFLLDQRVSIKPVLADNKNNIPYMIGSKTSMIKGLAVIVQVT